VQDIAGVDPGNREMRSKRLDVAIQVPQQTRRGSVARGEQANPA
jgi:hypothetical protein